MPPPPAQQQQPPRRTPLDIDDVAIDFSAVKPRNATAASAAADANATQSSATAGTAGMAGLLDQTQLQDSARAAHDNRVKVSDVRAFDPGLQGIAQRHVAVAGAAASRRKKVFGGQPFLPPSAMVAEQEGAPSGTASHSTATATATTAEKTTAETSAQDAAAASQDALDFLLSAQQQQQSSSSDLLQRREAYQQELREFWVGGRTIATALSSSPSLSALSNTSNSHVTSLHTQLFADGVPDIEPWDRWTSAMPRYGEARHLVVNPNTATPKQIHEAQLDLVHHPVIPDSHYTRHYQYRDRETPVVLKEYKTKEELRAERRERLQAKQASKQRERAAAASAAGTLEEVSGAAGALSLASSSLSTRLLHDRLSTKNLALNLFASSVLNPLAADTKVLEQYELRNLEHQRRNHDRHVAALPEQILKRSRDQLRYAAEHPFLRAYRVFPIYAPAHLGKIRHYANDNLLRGFVLYVGDCDALIVLAGGEKALRHLEHWILHKMEWTHPDTRANRLVSIPLMDAESFSFHLPKTQGGRVYKQGKLVEASAVAEVERASAREPVFLNFVPTVAEGESFLRQLPAPSSPWADLTALWRTAFLRAGLQQE